MKGKAFWKLACTRSCGRLTRSTRDHATFQKAFFYLRYTRTKIFASEIENYAVPTWCNLKIFALRYLRLHITYKQIKRFWPVPSVNGGQSGFNKGFGEKLSHSYSHDVTWLSSYVAYFRWCTMYTHVGIFDACVFLTSTGAANKVGKT